MSEQTPAPQPGPEKIAASQNRWRRLGTTALVGAALILPAAANASPAQSPKPVPVRIAEAVPQTTTPEEEVTVTCDMGCDGDGITDANNPLDQVIADEKAAGIDGINQRVIIDNIVDVPGLTTGFSTKNCSPTSPFFKLGPLIQVDNKVQEAGMTFRVNIDSPNLAMMQPRVVKCISYTLAKALNSQTAGGGATVTHFMVSKEQNDPAQFNGPASLYAKIFEAASAGFHAGNKSAVVAVGGVRTDGVGIDSAEWEMELAAADPNITAEEFGVHIYPTKLQKALARQNTKQSKDAATALFVAAVAKARQDINNAWPNRAYVPGAQYASDAEPLAMEIDEEGYGDNGIDPNGVDMAVKAELVGRQILSMISNKYYVVMQAGYHFIDESRNPQTGKPGFQTGFEYESGPNADQWPMNRDTAMTRMMPVVMAKVRQARSS